MARERESWQRDDKRDYGSDDLGYEDRNESWRSQGRSGNEDFHGGSRWRGGQYRGEQYRGEQGGQRYGEEYGESRYGANRGGYGGARGGYGGQSGYGQSGEGGWRGGERGYGRNDPYRQGEAYEGGYQGGEQGDWRHGGSRGGWGGERGYGERGYGERGYMGSRGGYSGNSRGSQDRDFWDRASDEVSSWFGDEEAERRRRRDQHKGKGPRGYTRSDDRIKEDVNDRLTDDWAVDASDVEVDVENCEVTLTGEVSSREMKRRAEDVAEEVSGVKHVQNNLRIKQSGQSETTGSSGSTAI